MAPRTTPVALEIDRSVDPSPVFVFRLTAGGLPVQIGAVSSTGIWTPTGPNGSAFAPSAFTDTTNAGNISSGILPAARLPTPTLTTLGAVLASSAPLNQFATGISATTNALTFAQPTFSNLNGSIASSQIPLGLALPSPSLTGTPNTPSLTGYLYGNGGAGWTASQYIPSGVLQGTISGNLLPAPTASVLGGVLSGTAPTNQFQTGIAANGAPSFAQPAFGNLAGQIASGQVPSGLALTSPVLSGTPSTPTLTGYLYGNAGSGWTAATSIPTLSLSGILQAAQHPALTGDVTSLAGSLTTTLATVNAAPGAFGGASSIPIVTVNAKGLVTAVSTVAVVAPAGTLSGNTLNSTVTNSSLTTFAAGAALNNLAANSITPAYMSQAAPGSLRGNPTGATANVIDAALTTHMDAAFGAAQGTLISRGSSGWAALVPGTAGLVLTSNGPGSTPSYQSVSASAATPRGYLSGLTLSNDATNPNTVLDVAPGVATADDNTIPINLATTITKTLGSWAVGSGNGAIDVGNSVANSSYHAFLIQRTDTNVVDVLLSLSSGLVANQPSAPATISIGSPATITIPNHGLPMYSAVYFTTTGALPTGITANTLYWVGPNGYTANSFQITTTQNGTAVATSGSQSGTQTLIATPVMPANYTKKRRLGAVLTTSTASNITAFTQNGDEFLLATPVVNASGTAISANSALTLNTSAPTGLKIKARLGLAYVSATAGAVINFYAPDQSGMPALGVTAASPGLRVPVANQYVNGGQDIFTDTAGTIRAIAAAAGTAIVGTYGWLDTRGK